MLTPTIVIPIIIDHNAPISISIVLYTQCHTSPLCLSIWGFNQISIAAYSDAKDQDGARDGLEVVVGKGVKRGDGAEEMTASGMSSFFTSWWGGSFWNNRESMR